MDVIVTLDGTELECDTQNLSVSKKTNIVTKKNTGFLVTDNYTEHIYDIDKDTYDALVEYGCKED